MQLKSISAALLSAFVATGAMAQAYTDVAQVISSQPIYDRVSAPRQECWNETINVDRRTPAAGYQEARYTPAAAPARESSSGLGVGTVIGAIVGGVVGHQFGGSTRGRDHGTVAGVIGGGILGTMIGNASADNANTASTNYDPQPARNAGGGVNYTPETRSVQRCKTVDETREQISGYNVTYRYNGRDYQTRMAYDPGQSINVRVNLAPEIRNFR